jgi:hypothetical protein
MKIIIFFMVLNFSFSKSPEESKLAFVNEFINHPDSLIFLLQNAEFDCIYYLNRIKKHDRTLPYIRKLADNFCVKDSNIIFFEVISNCEYEIESNNGKSIHYGITILNKNRDFGLNFDWKLLDYKTWVLHEIVRVNEDCLDNFKEKR